MGELAALALECGSDKVGYCDVYEAYLPPLRHQRINLLEIGVGGYENPEAGGASVRMWKRYFTKAEIYALDFYDKSRHEKPRITIFRGDQDDEPLLNRMADKIGGIDVIIDDGSHVSAHVIRSFEVLFPRLNPGGLYIVEDLGTSYWPECGGSFDLNDPNTSINYFRRLVHGINRVDMRQPYPSSYADENVEFLHFYRNAVVIKKQIAPEFVFNVSEPMLELDKVKAENETLRADCVELHSSLTQRNSECAALAAAEKRWFDAVIAVTADHNPLAPALRTSSRWWKKFIPQPNGTRRSRIALANRARDAGNWELAVRYYRDALDDEIRDPEIWLQFSHALKMAGKTPRRNW